MAEMKLLVTFSRKAGKKPIIAQVVKDTGVLINVERAIIDSSEGEALIDIPDESCQLIKEKMASLGATVRVLDRGILLDESECVDCGACVSVCPQEVFYFDDNWVIHVNEGRCILCGRCIPACPHQALSQQEGS
jgi:L-aspartate semialdehyde sulfurtransferase ferredoxin